MIEPLSVIDGITLEDMTSSSQKGNLEPGEVRRATDTLKKDYPNGIPNCGADALRATLLSHTKGMRDVNLDILRAQGYSRPCNKTWNAYKFDSVVTNDQKPESYLENLTVNPNTTINSFNRPHHRWITR